MIFRDGLYILNELHESEKMFLNSEVMKMQNAQNGQNMYLTVEILGNLRVNCFYNCDHEKNPKSPIFKGNGVAVWVNEKQVKSTGGF